MKSNKFIKLATLFLFMLFLFSGLGFTKPVTAEILEKQISVLVKDNIKQESKINDLLSASKSYLAKSKQLKDEGELLIKLGEKGQLESFNNYTLYVSQMGKTRNSNALKQELKYLKKLYSSWQDYDKKIIDGEDSIEKSTKLNIKGIKANDEASRKMVQFEKTKTQLDQLIEKEYQLHNADLLETN